MYSKTLFLHIVKTTSLEGKRRLKVSSIKKKIVENYFLLK